MIRTFNKLYSAAILGLLTLMGFSGCGLAPRDEYGSPSARYKVRGTAVDEVTGRPVEGLKAVTKSDWNADSVYTDADGKFELKLHTSPTNTILFRIEDVDGPENGSYAEHSREIDFSDAKYKGKSGSWYRGEATEELGDVVMKEARRELR